MEILFFAQEREANKMRYCKGYPVIAKEDDFSWGGDERDPNKFVRVKVPCTTEEAESVVGGWNRKTTYTITAFDPLSDTFSVKMFADDSTVAGDEGTIDVDMLEEFLTDWGAVIDHSSSSLNDVRFTLKAIDALNGKGYIYFGQEDEFVNFTEALYDPVTGLHRIDADYSNSTLKEAVVRSTLEQAKATLISIDHDKGLFTFETTRDIMKAELEEDVREKFDILVSRARYYLLESVVDSIKTVGGFSEMSDFQTLKNNMVDKLGGF